MRGHDCTFSSDIIIVNSPQLWTAFSWVWRPSPSYRAPHKTNSSDGATDERAGDLNKQKRIISLYTRAAKTYTILPNVLGPIGVWCWVFGSRSVFKVTQRCSAGISSSTQTQYFWQYSVLLWYIVQYKLQMFVQKFGVGKFLFVKCFWKKYIKPNRIEVMQNCIFSIITPIFSVTWSFRNHYNMMIYCSRNISY